MVRARAGWSVGLGLACAVCVACGDDSADENQGPESDAGADVGPADGGDTDGGAPDGGDGESDAGEGSFEGPDPLPALRDTPIDLVPWSRLTASATRTIALWPREDLSAIATVRDDAPNSAFEAPFGEATTVCVDWQPWVRSRLRIDAVDVDATADAYPIAVRAVRACGLAETAVELGTIGGADAPLELDLAVAGALELVLAPGADVQIDAISVLSRDSRAVVPEFPAPVSDRAHIGGVIEGFYGVPWSWREREDLLRAMAVGGLQTFVYAPKRDPLHRDEWRGTYDQAFVDRFGALAQLGESLEVHVFFGISPFIDFDGDADFEILATKMERFVDVGLRGVMLLADDIEDGVDRPIDAALGALHVDVANRLLERLRADRPDLEFWFVPTVYSDERLTTWPQGEAYLAEMVDLHPDIEVLWTGPGTSNLTMDADDLDVVAGYIGRTPYIWENYWANDGGDGLFGRMLLAPFEGRGPDLLPAVRGIAQNPLIQGALARLNMGGFAAWMADPTLTPDQQRDIAVERELAFALRAGADPSLAPALQLLTDVFDGHARRDPTYPDMIATVDALRAVTTIDADALPTLQQALRLFADMAVLNSTLYHATAHPDLVDDAIFPVLRAQADGALGLARLMQWREAIAGRPDTVWSERADAAIAAGDACRFQASPGVTSRLEALLSDAPTAALGDWTLPEPPTCRVGVPTTWTFDGDWAWVAGLPGGSLEGPTVTFTAPHAGVYEVIAVATRTTPDLSWSVRPARIVCR